MYTYPVTYLIQYALETCAFLVILAVGLIRWRDGLWAVLATVGGALGLVVAALQLTVFAEARFFHTSHVVDFVLGETDRVSDILGWVRVAGLVLIAAAMAVRASGSSPSRPQRAEDTV